MSLWTCRIQWIWYLNIQICHFGRKDIHLDIGWSFLLKQCFRSLLQEKMKQQTDICLV